MIQFWLVIITGIVMLIGLAGVFLPVIPGIELVWLAALGYGIFDGVMNGFSIVGIICFTVITVLVAIGLSSDFWITGIGMKTTGTSLLAIFIGGTLLVLGSLFFTPVVGVLLALAGVLAVEWFRLRNWKKAFTSAGTALAGCGLSYGFKFTIGLMMTAVWLVWVVVG
jgi:uncharacterized protein